MKKKFYIAVPGNAKTGGPECMQQLCQSLRKQGYDSRIFYYGTRVPDIIDYYGQLYGNIEAETCCDKSAWLILAEIEDPIVWRAKGWENICIWWLSANRIYKLRNYHNTYHLFQSFYARDQLGIWGIRGPLVEDYCNQSLINSLELPASKENIVIINHRSAHLARRLIWQCPGIKFVLAADMSQRELALLMRKAKLFVDLGWHPGRDRMPREAAIAKCIVVTNRMGSARGADIPLPDKLKLKKEEVVRLHSIIQELVLNYHSEVLCMKSYVDWVKQKNLTFDGQAVDFTVSLALESFQYNENFELIDNEWVGMQQQVDSLRDVVSRLGMLECRMYQFFKLKRSGLDFIRKKIALRIQNFGKPPSS